MDPVTIIQVVGTAFSLGEVIIKSIMKLSLIKTRYHDAPLHLTTMIGQLHIVKSALDQLETLSRLGHSQHSYHQQLSQQFDRALDSLGPLIHAIEDRLCPFESIELADMTIEERITFLWKEKDLSEYSILLDRQVCALTLLLQAVNCSSWPKQQELLSRKESVEILRRAKDCSTSVISVDDSESTSVVTESTDMISLKFDFDNTILETKIYQRAQRSYLKEKIKSNNRSSPRLPQRLRQVSMPELKQLSAQKPKQFFTEEFKEVSTQEPKQTFTQELMHISTQELIPFVKQELIHIVKQELQQVFTQDLKQSSTQELKQAFTQELKGVFTQELKKASAQELKEVSAQEPKEVSAQEVKEVSAQEPKEVSAQEVKEVSAPEPKEVSGQELVHISTQELLYVVKQKLESVLAGLIQLTWTLGLLCVMCFVLLLMIGQFDSQPRSSTSKKSSEESEQIDKPTSPDASVAEIHGTETITV